jgi:hypothetical protein
VKDRTLHISFRAFFGREIGSSNMNETSLFIDPLLLHVLFLESITMMILFWDVY